MQTKYELELLDTRAGNKKRENYCLKDVVVERKTGNSSELDPKPLITGSVLKSIKGALIPKQVIEVYILPRYDKFPDILHFFKYYLKNRYLFLRNKYGNNEENIKKINEIFNNYANTLKKLPINIPIKTEIEKLNDSEFSSFNTYDDLFTSYYDLKNNIILDMIQQYDGIKKGRKYNKRCYYCALCARGRSDASNPAAAILTMMTAIYLFYLIAGMPIIYPSASNATKKIMEVLIGVGSGITASYATFSCIVNCLYNKNEKRDNNYKTKYNKIRRAIGFFAPGQIADNEDNENPKIVLQNALNLL